jgi:hypothetical protein
VIELVPDNRDLTVPTFVAMMARYEESCHRGRRVGQGSICRSCRRRSYIPCQAWVPFEQLRRDMILGPFYNRTLCCASMRVLCGYSSVRTRVDHK